MADTNETAKTQVHGTAIILDGRGVLIRGPSGSGKSDLALRLMNAGGRLVADDRVNLALCGDMISMSAPPNLEGKLEIRGIGIVRVDFCKSAQLNLTCDLMSANQINRYPSENYAIFLAQQVPLLKVDANSVSATLKVQYALKISMGEIGLVR